MRDPQGSHSPEAGAHITGLKTRVFISIAPSLGPTMLVHNVRPHQPPQKKNPTLFACVLVSPTPRQVSGIPKRFTFYRRGRSRPFITRITVPENRLNCLRMRQLLSGKKHFRTGTAHAQNNTGSVQLAASPSALPSSTSPLPCDQLFSGYPCNYPGAVQVWPGARCSLSEFATARTLHLVPDLRFTKFHRRFQKKGPRAVPRNHNRPEKLFVRRIVRPLIKNGSESGY
jgi:hypothetical protein